jgi:hypothetical protein
MLQLTSKTTKLHSPKGYFMGKKHLSLIFLALTLTSFLKGASGAPAGPPVGPPFNPTIFTTPTNKRLPGKQPDTFNLLFTQKIGGSTYKLKFLGRKVDVDDKEEILRCAHMVNLGVVKQTYISPEGHPCPECVQFAHSIAAPQSSTQERASDAWKKALMQPNRSGITSAMLMMRDGNFEGIPEDIIAATIKQRVPGMETTVLHLAAFLPNNAAAIKKLLAKGANPNATDKFGRRPLDTAHYNKDAAAIALLEPVTAK